MSKNKCGLILTITGILVIIIVSVTISIKEYNKNKIKNVAKTKMLYPNCFVINLAQHPKSS